MNLNLIKYDFTEFGLQTNQLTSEQIKQVILNQEFVKMIQKEFNEMDEMNRPFCYECGLPDKIHEWESQNFSNVKRDS